MIDLIKNKYKFDLIYIDGSHLFEGIFIDLYYSTILLNINGIVLFDDSVNQNTKKLISFLKNNYQLIYKEIDYNKYDNSQKSLKKILANSTGYRQIAGFKKISEPPRKKQQPLLEIFKYPFLSLKNLKIMPFDESMSGFNF